MKRNEEEQNSQSTPKKNLGGKNILKQRFVFVGFSGLDGSEGGSAGRAPSKQKKLWEHQMT